MRSVEHDARRERVGLKDTVQAGSAWAGRDPRDWSRGIFEIMVLYTSQEVRDLLLIIGFVVIIDCCKFMMMWNF